VQRAIQTFQISLKAAIISNGRLLLLKEADTGYWELPGGRIDVGEERIPQAAVLAREISEELGSSVRVSIDDRAVTWVRQHPDEGHFQLIVARLCRLDAGEIRLSNEHAELRWTTSADWPSLQFPPLSDYADGLARLWAIQKRQ
jgi:8-oxo-dGTP diphosphatase